MMLGTELINVVNPPIFVKTTSQTKKGTGFILVIRAIIIDCDKLEQPSCAYDFNNNHHPYEDTYRLKVYEGKNLSGWNYAINDHESGSEECRQSPVDNLCGDE